MGYTNEIEDHRRVERVTHAIERPPDAHLLPFLDLFERIRRFAEPVSPDHEPCMTGLNSNTP